MELRRQCQIWRHRAEMHAATTLGLVGLARMTREHALQMKKERDMWERRCTELKCEIAEHGSISLATQTASKVQRATGEYCIFSTHSDGNSAGLLLSKSSRNESQVVCDPWTSPPVGEPICLPPLPPTPPRAHNSLHAPHSPSLDHMVSLGQSRPASPVSEACSECERVHEDLCESESEDDSEPPHKRWKLNDDGPVLAAREGASASKNKSLHRSARQRAKHAVARYLGIEENTHEVKPWVL
jgi:hypothetical protein